jgi:hypothetical protein
MGHRYSLEKIEIFRLEGIIIENIIKEGVVLELADVKGIKEINLQICNNQNYALLVDAKDESTITEDARALLASEELAKFNIAKAIIIHTHKQKILGNLYLTVNRPHVKTRLFTDREKALNWLRKKITDFAAKELLEKVKKEGK